MLKIEDAHRVTRRRSRAVVAAAVSLAAGLVLSACSSSGTNSGTGPSSSGAAGNSSSSSSNSGSGVTAAMLQKTVDAALLKNVPASTLPPVMQEALKQASIPLSQAQLATALKCWKASSCTLGSGSQTLAEADGFGDNTWRQFSKMNVILQALTYPQIGKFIYTNAHGQLAAYQSQIRSLTAQGVKMIVAYNDFGASAWPAFSQAQRAGAAISTFVGPNDGAPTSAITTRVQPNICDAGKTMAAVTKSLVGSSPVAYFTGTPGNPEDAGWQKCATAAGVHSIYNGTTNWTPAGAQTAASALIASGKPVKAILYSYSNPVNNILKAYKSAGKQVPDIVTWTTDNGTLCTYKQHPYTLYLTNALNWAARVSVTALIDHAAGQSVPAAVYYPFPFIKANANDCSPSKPADYPGPSALVPLGLANQMLGHS